MERFHDCLKILYRTIEANKEPLFLRVYYLTPVKILHGKYWLINMVCELFHIQQSLKQHSYICCTLSAAELFEASFFGRYS